jgi:hypothetical protein
VRYHHCPEVTGIGPCSVLHSLSKPMAIGLTGRGHRPHLRGPQEGKCWCRPTEVECSCDKDHGTVWGHGEPQGSCDTQPRLMVFSRLTR